MPRHIEKEQDYLNKRDVPKTLELLLLCEHERTAWSTALSSWDVGVQVCVCLHVGHNVNYLQPFKESANEKFCGKSAAEDERKKTKEIGWDKVKKWRMRGEKKEMTGNRGRNKASQRENKGGKRGRDAMCCTPEP